MNEEQAKALARAVADPDTVDPVHSGKPDFVVLTVQEFIAATEKYAAEQVAAATARDSAIIKMVDEARTAGRYSDAEEWDAIDAAIRARAQEEGK